MKWLSSRMECTRSYFCSFSKLSHCFNFDQILFANFFKPSNNKIWFSCPRLSSQLWWRVRTRNWWGWKFLRCFSFKLQCLKEPYCGLKERFWECVPKQIISDHSKRSCFKLRQHHLRVHHPYTASHQNRGFITFHYPFHVFYCLK